ncbi:MAG: LapA family protein [Nocardioides sp.]
MTESQPPEKDTASTTPETQPETPSETAPPPGRDDPLRGSRTGAMWAAVAALALLLIMLTVFIVQNTEEAQVAFLGWDGTAPMAAVLLIAATSGMLLVLIAGTLRIWQLRRRVRRSGR